MASVVKKETPDSASGYDLEYRASEDDAWYSVYAVLNASAETLTVKYLCSPAIYEVVFNAGDFRTEAQVDELVGRFRPVSQQVQDYDCLKLSIGKTVCAAHGTGDDDLRFYDAVVEAVDRRSHSFSDGEEECLCTFVLFWQHGRGRGTLTTVNIDGICNIEPAIQIDPRISVFTKMAKKKIASLGLQPNGKKVGCASVETEPSPNTALELETKRLENLTNSTEDLQKNDNSEKWMNQDEDMGPKSSYAADNLAIMGGHFFIVINNLEKDLTTSVIKNFIDEKTNILPEACVFPSLFTDPFARGVIIVDSQEKAHTIHEYLDNPNHMVVSTRGRPWVITQKADRNIFGASIRNFIPPSQEKIKHKNRELEVVASGTESYKRAKKSRDLIVNFLNHESEVSKRLVLEEERILHSFKPPKSS